MDFPLWPVLQFLALEMPTHQVLYLLKVHTHLLTQYMIMEYDDVCKATMEGAKHPIATALLLSRFMFQQARVDLFTRIRYSDLGGKYRIISRKLLREIESDHLLAMLLEIPTDLGGLSIMEIALKYGCLYFLEDPRIVRIFKVLYWFGGFDFLDPGSNFKELELQVSFADVYSRLVREPGRFYFSPVGKFYTALVSYVFSLCLFSYITLIQRYNYDDPDILEWVLWVFILGFVMEEVVPFIGAPRKHLANASFFFRIFPTCNWIVLAYLRIFDDKNAYRKFNETGQLDDIATRNQFRVEIYMFLWSIQCILLWTHAAIIFDMSCIVTPLIEMILTMRRIMAYWSILISMLFIGTGLAVYYIIGMDLVQINNTGGIFSIYLYIFQTLLRQQDWDLLRSAKNDDGVVVFDNIRSGMCTFFILIFIIFGSILLLNLLIAMMTSTYDIVKFWNDMKLTGEKIHKTYVLDRSHAIIPPPINLIAYILYLYWWAFEIITWILTFGRLQLNEEYFSPLNHGAHQYRPGDYVKFEKGGKIITALVKKRTSIQARLSGNTQGMDRRRITIDGKRSADENSKTVWDLEVSYKRKKYELRDSDVLAVKKPFYKRRTQRIPTVDNENKFCKSCRYNISSDIMDIQYYLNIFEQKEKQIDPIDELFIKSLLSPSDSKYLLPNPKTCDLCPNCFRPFYISRDGKKDVLIRREYILEIVSYFAYRIFIWPLLILIMTIPAIITILFAACAEKIKSKSPERVFMSTTEQNDDYRATVRRLSKPEENADLMVKRIDLNVVRLEKQILGCVEAEYEPDDQEIDEIESFTNDSFDKRADSMRKEMHDRFDEMRRLLEESGIVKYWD